jgi:hypothetical protein
MCVRLKLTQDGVKWRIFLKIVMNLQVSRKARKLLSI